MFTKTQKMAASGGSADWSTAIKPILYLLYGQSYDKNDVIEIVQAILKSENEFQKHEESFDLFYTCFATLAADYIAVNAANLPLDHLGNISEACRIILGQLLRKLSEQAISQWDDGAVCHLSVSQLLLPIVGLCGIEGGGLSRDDQVIVTSLLKNTKLPPHMTTNALDSGSKTPGQSTPITSLSSSSSHTSDKQQTASGQRRSDALLEQLTTPVRSPACLPLAAAPAPAGSGALVPVGSGADGVETAKDGSASTLGGQPAVDVKKWLNSTCTQLLMTQRAGGVMVRVCWTQPFHQRYIVRIMEAQTAGTAPQFQADAMLLHYLVSEVHVSQLALSLPCLEPLTPERISVLCQVSAAWLLCACSQASIHPKDEEKVEQQIASLVEGALSLFNIVGEILKHSTRAGGYIYQNHLMIGGWVLLSGLHHALAGAPCPSQPPTTGKSPGKQPSRSYNINKIQQSVHVVWVALGARCLSVIGALLEDARMEALGTGTGVDSQSTPIEPARLDELDQGTACARAARLTQCAPLHQLLVVLGVVCYRKATNLKRAVVQKQHQDTDADQSDSTIYYQDMILCSETSESEDDDSEPLLGLWFESTLVAPELAESGTAGGVRSAMAEGADQDAGSRTHAHGTLVPDKAEPYSYISLALDVFNLLCTEVIGTGAERLGNHAQQLQEAQVALLAALVRDLDRETARTDTGTISACFGARLGALYASFSSALVRYLHNLVGAPSFSGLQPALLQHLGIGALPGDRGALAPLQVGCRVVKLIGGIILSKPVSERETCILSVWHRVVNTLVECALQSTPSQDHEYEDLNVEHAQLLVYLFHSLNLMQKKSILLMTSNAIIKVTDSLGIANRSRAKQLAPHQPMLATRLMLLLEYLMRHLYDAPQTLLQQIEWNLVIAPGLAQQPAGEQNSGGEAGVPRARIYCAVPLVEQAYRKMSHDETSMRPKFYALTNAEINNQEMPKFDGLACNFVLGTPHKLKYPLLLDALLALLNSACVCDVAQQPPALLCAAHYAFQTAWRLIVSMPPSTPHMDRLQAGMEAVLTPPLPLHAIVWAPRADNKKVFNPWLKDALVKQGMYTQYAETLLSGVSSACDNITYTAWLASETIKHLKENTQEGGLPCLLDVISCDAALVRLRVCLADIPPAGSPTDAHLVSQFMPHLLDLIETVFQCYRLCASWELEPLLSCGPEVPPAVAEARLRVCGASGAGEQLGTWLRAQLPGQANLALERIAAAPHTPGDHLTSFASDMIPSESAALAVVASHCEHMSASQNAAGASLRALAASAARLLETGAARLAADEDHTLADRAVALLAPATTDGRLEFITEACNAALHVLVPSAQKVEQLVLEHILRTTYPILVENLQPSTEKILRHMVKYWEKILDRPAGRLAFEAVFSEDSEYSLGEVLLTAPNARSTYSERIIKEQSMAMALTSQPPPVSLSPPASLSAPGSGLASSSHQPAPASQSPPARQPSPARQQPGRRQLPGRRQAGSRQHNTSSSRSSRRQGITARPRPLHLQSCSMTQLDGSRTVARIEEMRARTDAMLAQAALNQSEAAIKHAEAMTVMAGSMRTIARSVERVTSKRRRINRRDSSD